MNVHFGEDNAQACIEATSHAAQLLWENGVKIETILWAFSHSSLGIPTYCR